MFCPSCGAEYTIELKYCNRCGANLSSALTEPTNSVSLNVTKAVAAVGTTMAVVTLGGFIALILGAIKLAEKTNFASDAIMFAVLLGTVIILTADIFLGIQLSRLIKASLTPQSLRRGMNPPSLSPELPKPTTARLAPAASVTENTTRFLEDSYRPPTESQPRNT